MTLRRESWLTSHVGNVSGYNGCIYTQLPVCFYHTEFWNTWAERHFVSHDLYVACYVDAGCLVPLVLVLVVDPSVLISSCRVCVVFTFWVWYLVCGACVFSLSCFPNSHRHYLIFHLGTEGSHGGDIIWVWSWWLFFHLSPCVRVLRHESPSLPE